MPVSTQCSGMIDRAGLDAGKPARRCPHLPSDEPPSQRDLERVHTGGSDGQVVARDGGRGADIAVSYRASKERRTCRGAGLGRRGVAVRRMLGSADCAFCSSHCAALGRLDVLVNMASIYGVARSTDDRGRLAAEHRHQSALGLLCARAAVPHMRRRAADASSTSPTGSRRAGAAIRLRRVLHGQGRRHALTEALALELPPIRFWSTPSPRAHPATTDMPRRNATKSPRHAGRPWGGESQIAQAVGRSSKRSSSPERPFAWMEVVMFASPCRDAVRLHVSVSQANRADHRQQPRHRASIAQRFASKGQVAINYIGRRPPERLAE